MKFMRRGWHQLFLVLLSVLAGGGLHAQVSVFGKVTDETGLAVTGVRVELRAKASGKAASAVSDVAGNFTLQLASAGEFAVRAERQGFFLYSGGVELSQTSQQLTITLNHLQEFAESIDVRYSPPVIDLQETADKKQLDNVEILTVPYPASQDLRNALPLMNGVVADPSGRIHFNGGSSDQTDYQLDGFRISDPPRGRLEARLHIESPPPADPPRGPS